MSLKLGDPAPNFTADTTHGMINFYEWMNNCWTILMSHPKDFSPVCTTELLWLARNQEKFTQRNIKIIGLSVDKLIHHSKWLDGIKQEYNVSVTTPIISDKNMRIAKLYGMPQHSNKQSNSINVIARTVYIISPDKKVAAALTYPVNTGRNFGEILRLLDSLFVTKNNCSATPANWQQGDSCILANRDAANETILGFPQEISVTSAQQNVKFDNILEVSFAS